ncbi:hypothetical protein DEU42_105128 [Flavobacterium sp. AG291]|nr:hypothetical protein DEU42_105128 [Flavobacterium sp. AG291]
MGTPLKEGKPTLTLKKHKQTMRMRVKLAALNSVALSKSKPKEFSLEFLVLPVSRQKNRDYPPKHLPGPFLSLG